MNSRSCPQLAIVVPCFNEDAVLPLTYEVLLSELTQLKASGAIDESSYLLFVDDGSSDKTWELISNYHHANSSCVKAIRLAHNKGHQNALFAGLSYVQGAGVDACVSLDADLQDDPSVIHEMLTKYAQGCEIVYGVRHSRESDTKFKRDSAHAFYSLMQKLGVELVSDAADFRLMGKRALDALMQYNEVNLFLRGIVPSLGFQTATVEYTRAKRAAGESKYPLSSMTLFACEGITSFSNTPVRLVFFAGLAALVVALLVIIYALVSLITGNVVSGWTSTILSIWLVGGMLMVCLGIVGEYVGKIYLETKARPRFIISDTLD